MEFDLNNQGEIGESLRDAGAGLEEQQPAEAASAAVSAASLYTHVAEEENLWAFPVSSLGSPAPASQSILICQDLSSSQSCSPPESLLGSSTSCCSKCFCCSPCLFTEVVFSILSISRGGKLQGLDNPGFCLA